MSDAVDAFDEAARSYDDWYSTPKGRQVFSAEMRLIEALLPKRGVGLEIGAGTGVFAKALTDVNRQVVCLDLSREMLMKAAAKGLPCILGSADSSPLRSRSLGFAYMVTVIEFLADPVASLRETSRVMVEDASSVVLFINRESLWGKLYAEMAEKGDLVFSHAHLYTKVEVEEMGRTADLRPDEAQGTLTTGPTSLDAGDDIVNPSTKTGVIAIKFTKRH
jgi:ubiquinone/menaquinone biosynthesis C-methylase UbiE